ncbi:unnamed protein product [Peniophora sp. CBMAI 1063]|nr:unnamed protein product [Peniophora sp. CBMAI 1063]
MSSAVGVTKLEAALRDVKSMFPGTILGTFLFGSFTLLLALSVHILRQRGLRTRAYAVMLTLVVLMYALAATSWAILVSSILQVVGLPEVYAMQNAAPLIIKDKTLQWCLGLNVFMSDIIVAWRTWSLWSTSNRGRWIGLIGCLLLFGTAAAGCVDLAMFSFRTIIPEKQYASTELGYDNEPSIVYANFSGELGVIFSAILNVSCVLLAAVKTWQLERIQKPIGRRLTENRVGMILLLLVSCELAYCVFWVYWIVAGIYETQKVDSDTINLTFLIANNTAAAQITGIYPTFVVVCVSLQKHDEEDNVPSIVWQPHARTASLPLAFDMNVVRPPAEALTIPLELIRCSRTSLYSETLGEGVTRESRS